MPVVTFSQDPMVDQELLSAQQHLDCPGDPPGEEPEGLGSHVVQVSTWRIGNRELELEGCPLGLLVRTWSYWVEWAEIRRPKNTKKKCK